MWLSRSRTVQAGHAGTRRPASSGERPATSGPTRAWARVHSSISTTATGRLQPRLPARAYPPSMGLSTGSPTWDTVLQIAIAAALLVSIVLLIKNFRGR